MTINQIEIRHLDVHYSRIIKFEECNVVYSEKNSTGKTTLLRSILYGMGYDIHNTKEVKFDRFEIGLEITRDEQIYKTRRIENILSINGEDYELPTQLEKSHSIIFGIGNLQIIENILGVIYFDQDNGWTNYGTQSKSFGIKFNLDGFFRGLNNIDVQNIYTIQQEIKTCNEKINKYKLLYDLGEYQKQYSKEITNKFEYITVNQKNEMERQRYQQQLSDIEKEIDTIDKIIKKNDGFAGYIEKHKVYVAIPNSNERLLLTREYIADYDRVEDINKARLNILKIERSKIKGKIAKYEKEIENQLTMRGLTLEDTENELQNKLSQVEKIDPIQVKAFLDRYSNRKKECEEKLKQLTKQENIYIAKCKEIIARYAKEIGGVGFSDEFDIFSQNKGKFSGAMLHKLVFICKLAYIELLSEYLQYKIPIIIDSPAGREIEQESINIMLSILKRDFGNHQIIIASINKYDNIFENIRIIELQRQYFEQERFI